MDKPICLIPPPVSRVKIFAIEMTEQNNVGSFALSDVQIVVATREENATYITISRWVKEN